MKSTQSAKNISFRSDMASKTFWSEQVLIALTKINLDLISEYHKMLAKKLGSEQKCSDTDLILVLADKWRLFQGFIS